MSSKIPVFGQIAWFSLIAQFLIIGILLFLWYQIDDSNYIIFGAISYWVIAQLLRRTISKEHRKGMQMVRKENFKDAIPHFEKSYQYFKQNEWIDKYRFLTLLSSGKISYKEMALNNVAFCYGQIGNGKLAMEYYQKTLDEFPDSGIAGVGLRLLKSMENDGE
ncbi:MAG: hypothetical protein R2784_20175 [Saprospiraceae bacterium]